MPIKINPSPPPLPPQKSTVKKVHMGILNGWKKRKQMHGDYHILVHTIGL